MRIGIVCPYDLAAPGGVQQLVTELATELRLGGDEVMVVGAGRDDGEGFAAEPAVEKVGRSLTVRANDSLVPFTLSPFSWTRVRKVLADLDVVHVHEPFIPLVGWAALGIDRPSVATFHAAPPEWVPRIYRMLPVRSKMRRSVLTAVSQTAAAGVPKEWGRVEIIPNAIDAASYDLPVDRVEHQVCFLGRDEPRKGLDVLLEAWPQIRTHIPHAVLKVMGPSRVTMNPGVEFLGRVTGGEKKAVLASSLVYVAPNLRGESFGIVVAEGLAAGCAVVASDLAAFRDVAGENARYVPPGDPEALASAVVELLEAPSGAMALGAGARAHARRYDWPHVADRYRQAYRVALGLAAMDGR